MNSLGTEKNVQYKTFRFYHFIKAEYVEDFLTNGRLKVTQLGHSNDCFEFRPGFSCPEVESEWKKTIQGGEPCVICLTSRMSSPVVWGHYGDKGRGVCLVFDIPIEKYTNPQFPDLYRIYGIQLPLGKVKYQKKQHVIDKIPVIGSIEMNDLVVKLACIKAKDWEYEQEYRVCLPESLLQADNGKLFYSGFLQYCSAVLLGWECPLSRLYLERIKTLCGIMNMWILSTQPSRDKFEISVCNLNGQEYSDTDGALIDAWLNQ